MSYNSRGDDWSAVIAVIKETQLETRTVPHAAALSGQAARGHLPGRPGAGGVRRRPRLLGDVGGEHFLLPWENMPSPELFIARALGVTRQMAFGTGVSLAHFHNPAHLAHRIAQLDHMARGRIYLGIGAGGSTVDSELFDIDEDKGTHRERMAECIDLVLKIWKGEPFEHSGKFYTVKLGEAQPESRIGFHMRPYQEPHPQIAVAGSSPYSSTLEMVGEMGWIPLSSSFMHETYLPSHRVVFERGAKRGGQGSPDRRVAHLARGVRRGRRPEGEGRGAERADRQLLRRLLDSAVRRRRSRDREAEARPRNAGLGADAGVHAGELLDSRRPGGVRPQDRENARRRGRASGRCCSSVTTG